jgi:hypothetical protein
MWCGLPWSAVQCPQLQTDFACLFLGTKVFSCTLFIIMCLVSSALWTYHGSANGFHICMELGFTMNLLTCTPHICCCQEWMILWDLTAMCTDCGDSFFLNPVNWTICEGLPTFARVCGDSFSTQLIEQFVKNCQLLPKSVKIPFSSTQLTEQFVKNCQLLPESVEIPFQLS